MEAAVNEHAREANTVGKRAQESRGRLWDWRSTASKGLRDSRIPDITSQGGQLAKGGGGVGLYQVCIKAISRVEVPVGVSV